MQQSFAAALALVLKNEGGYVNLPHDPGGATNMGITRKTLAAWRGVSVNSLPKSAVKALTVGEAGTIYRARYWTPIYADDLPAGLDYAVFDYAVNSGPVTAARALQSVLGVTVDGRIGPETVTAAKLDPAGTINRLCDARLRYLQGLGTWGRFGTGWSHRVASVRAAALDMAAGAQFPAPVIQPAAYIVPQPIEPTPAVVKARLGADGSRTIAATDGINKAITVGGTAVAGVSVIGQLTDALQAIPWWGYALAAVAVLATIWLLNHRIVLARIEDAITGAHTGRDIGLVRPEPSPEPQGSPLAADRPSDGQTQPEAAEASPDANGGQAAAGAQP